MPSLSAVITRRRRIQPDAPQESHIEVGKVMGISEIETHSVVRQILLGVGKMLDRACHPEMQC